ncbi:MAG: hypothetical protein EPN22_05965 [Nitrospirae bacterium]|nr:MAG: hypothetical protein EPN22_05965 [Nitrospirota bacterium]
MKRIIFAFLSVIAVSGACFAADSIPPGMYGFDDGNMSMTMNVMQMPDGKVFIDANGTSKDGKSCRVGDLGEFGGGKLTVGVCRFDITVSGDSFKINDPQNCAACQPGAYISGTYVKK